MRRALITRITGQDGSYLTEFLINKGNEAHGIVRRRSSLHRSRLAGWYASPGVYGKRLFLHYADLNDPTTLRRAPNWETFQRATTGDLRRTTSAGCGRRSTTAPRRPLSLRLENCTRFRISWLWNSTRWDWIGETRQSRGPLRSPRRAIESRRKRRQGGSRSRVEPKGTGPDGAASRTPRPRFRRWDRPRSASHLRHQIARREALSGLRAIPKRFGSGAKFPRFILTSPNELARRPEHNPVVCALRVITGPNLPPPAGRRQNCNRQT